MEILLHGETMKPLVLILCVAAMLPFRTQANEAPKRIFTPELMLQNEDLGEVRFTADGRHAIFEKHAPYREKRGYDRERDWGRSLSILVVADLASGEVREIRNSPDDRTWYLGSSPQGSRIAFGWFDDGVQKIGVYDLERGTERRLDVTGSTLSFPVMWTSESSFVLLSMPPDLQDRMMAFDGYSQRRVSAFSRMTWDGETSVKAVGSGRYRSKPNETVIDLVRIDALSGESERIDQGTIDYSPAPSPVGGRIAYLRKTGSVDLAGVKVGAVFGLEAIEQLTIYDPAAGRRVIAMCEGCSVNSGSMRWSPDGNQLFFSTRRLVGDAFEYAYSTHDVATDRTTALAFEGVALVPEEMNARPFTPVLWVDDAHLAVRTKNTAAGQFDDQDYRWHLLTREGKRVRELTAGLPRKEDKAAFKSPIAVRDGRLLFVNKGDLWDVPLQGAARNLSEAAGMQFESWCAGYAPWRAVNPRCDALGADNVLPAIDRNALVQGKIALRIMDGEVFSGEFAMLDLATGQVQRIARPDADSVALEATALGNAALFQRKSHEGDRLLLVAAGKAAVELHGFNRHLAGVAQADPVLLTRREAGEDEDRNDWLLLPPGHVPGKRYPLLVYFYPDTRYGKELKRDDLREISFLNKNIPAARGYAVLMASMKISDYGKAEGNPMREMHEQLVRAAENAVAQGYVDPTRWAIMGHSYGGYGTNSVITQTDRFKAAISLAGPSNLTSGYGFGMNANKAYAVPEGLHFGALWSEKGQGRMGTTPWEDPARYVANSPVFSSGRITAPLMLIHGDLDFVNVNEAEQLFSALHRQGKDVQLVRYWGEGHIIASPGNIADMWERIFTFLEQAPGMSGRDPVAGLTPASVVPASP
jgi:dipeptidyl aminopeptidase/acylaminoacyl peptidase